MVQVMLLAVVLGADPSAAEQKLIEKAKVKLEAWRDEQQKGHTAKVKELQADIEAADAGTINDSLTKPFVKKNGKYVFQSDGYKAKQMKEAQDKYTNYTINIKNNDIPYLKMLSPKKGDFGRLGDIAELGPGPKGHAFAITTASPDNNLVVKVPFLVANLDPGQENARELLRVQTFIVTGTIKHGGRALPRLLAFDP